MTNPQTLNLYGYVKNNPLRDTDPTGHSGDDDFTTVILNFAANAIGTFASDNAFGALRPSPQTVEGKLGQAVGDVAAQYTGATEAEAGIAGRTDALVLAGVGQEELAPEAIVASQAMILHGTATATIATANIAKSGIENTSSSKPYEDTHENTERMQQGKAPVGKDGKPVELHHEGQQPNGNTREMTQSEHRGGENFKKNHPNTGQEPSRIDRNQAARERRKHWKQKVNNSDE
jgi:hypothetical protein